MLHCKVERCSHGGIRRAEIDWHYLNSWSGTYCTDSVIFDCADIPSTCLAVIILWRSWCSTGQSGISIIAGN